MWMKDNNSQNALAKVSVCAAVTLRLKCQTVSTWIFEFFSTSSTQRNYSNDAFKVVKAKCVKTVHSSTPFCKVNVKNSVVLLSVIHDCTVRQQQKQETAQKPVHMEQK